jgi:hypothetical protein
MSDQPDPIPEAEPAGAHESADDGETDASAMRALLKRSLARDGENAPDLLAGVQRRIRARSRGKFYNDGWSTIQARANYALIGVVTLLLAVLAYYMLSPMGLR